MDRGSKTPRLGMLAGVLVGSMVVGMIWFGSGETAVGADAATVPLGAVSSTLRGVSSGRPVDAGPSNPTDAAAPVLWDRTIAPIFRRACAGCHSSGALDLSTESLWFAKRDPIRQRVLERRDMPPSGFPFTDEDRAAISLWLTSAR